MPYKDALYGQVRKINPADADKCWIQGFLDRHGDDCDTEHLLVHILEYCQERLADLYPCPYCDAEKEYVSRKNGKTYPCSHCMGKGWDMRALTAKSIRATNKWLASLSPEELEKFGLVPPEEKEDVD